MKTFAPTTIGWPSFWRSLIDTLAAIGTFALIAAIVFGCIAWMALMPSVGFLWLIGWL